MAATGSATGRRASRGGSETARFLNRYTPASMEALTVERGTPTAERVLLLQGMGRPPVMQPGIAGQYGVDALPGPDPLRPDGR